MGGWGFDDDGQRRRRDGESQSLHHEFAAKRNEVGEEAAREAATMVGVPLTTTTAISHRPDQRDLHRAGREQVRELVEAHGAAGDGGPRGGEGDQVRGGEELAGEAEAHHISPQAQVPAHAAELLADVHALHGALAGGGGLGSTVDVFSIIDGREETHPFTTAEDRSQFVRLLEREADRKMAQGELYNFTVSALQSRFMSRWQ